MIEKLSLIIEMIENSGRIGYITDDKFHVLWTNSEKSLIELLIESNHSGISKSLKKETVIACADGTAMKITPLTHDNKLIGYLFEQYESNSIIKMLSKTNVFNKFTDEYHNFRRSTLELLTYYMSIPENTTDKEYAEKTDKLYSDTANLTQLFKILTSESNTRIFDAYIPLCYCCGLMKIVSHRNAFIIETDIQQGLFIKAERSSFEFAIMNLLLNAYVHNSARNKKISVKAETDGNDIVLISITDNGRRANLEDIEKFRTLYKSQNTVAGEGLGITLTQIFADKYDADLTFKNTSKGGLSVNLKFKYYNIPDNNIYMYSSYSSSSTETHSELLNIMKKCFRPDDLRNIKL